jgi:hypothetical protein
LDSDLGNRQRALRRWFAGWGYSYLPSRNPACARTREAWRELKVLKFVTGN